MTPEAPLLLSQPTVSPPYPRGGMMSGICFDPGDGPSHYITVFFHFSQDEVGLIIRGIANFKF